VLGKRVSQRQIPPLATTLFGLVTRELLRFYPEDLISHPDALGYFNSHIHAGASALNSFVVYLHGREPLGEISGEAIKADHVPDLDFFLQVQDSDLDLAEKVSHFTDFDFHTSLLLSGCAVSYYYTTMDGGLQSCLCSVGFF
jgi:hypothetical protein